MRGLMQDWPLLSHTVLDHANIYFGNREIVVRLVEGPIHRTNYGEVHLRARKLSQALEKLGVGRGDVVATLAWNTHRHLESWYGIMGVGGVYHTLNPRLFPDQLAYIINHAEDCCLMLDADFAPLIEGMADKLASVKHYIFLTDKAHMPATKLKNALCYEDLLAAEDGDFRWAKMDENDAAGMCYTSGTTGNPKGVVYSHRSNVLHTFICTAADSLALRNQDSIMPVVPLFHANAWGLTFSAPACGAKLVMPGPKMDGESIYQLLDEEEVSLTAAVPTVWLMLLQYLEKTGKKLPHLRRVTIGGSAVPRVMLEKFERDYEVEVYHLWGMTEMSPLGTIGAPIAGMENYSWEQKIETKLKQGRPPYGVEMKISDDEGKDLPRDGKTFGHLLVRGPAVSSSYFKGEGGKILNDEGWFDTGDVATLDERGYMQITDRSKDVIKSGGEWISSIEIENLAVGHPGVAEAAVIGLPHPKWDERPLLIIVRKENADPKPEDIRAFMEDKIAKWWMPDDIVFVEEIPHTATGKIQKLTLREKFSDYTLPTAKDAAGTR